MIVRMLNYGPSWPLMMLLACALYKVVESALYARDRRADHARRDRRNAYRRRYAILLPPNTERSTEGEPPRVTVGAAPRQPETFGV